MKTTRREIIRLGLGTAGTLAAGSTLLHATGTMFPPPAAAASAGRVVVIGGGWGGLSTARALKRLRPATDIVVIEQNRLFMSCPMSNLYLGGVLPLQRLQFSYEALGRDGIRMVRERVEGIDRNRKVVETTGGKFEYDYLVMSAGIDYMWDRVPGLWEGRFDIPIAFKPGPEHLHLKRTIEQFQGGTFVLAIPEGPIRCPPGPYERVAMIAYRLKTRGVRTKLIVLDANAKPMSKGKGFLAAYENLYGDMVEYLPNHKVEAVDHQSRTITHSFGDLQYDAANIIPPMQAAGIVRQSGLGNRWAEANAADLTSKVDPNVYLVGDVIGNQPFPKSGFMANSVGNIVASHLNDRLDNRDASPLTPSNICYSMVDGDDGGRTIWVSHAFDWNSAESKYDRTAQVDLDPSLDNASTSLRWAEGIWKEMLG